LGIPLFFPAEDGRYVTPKSDTILQSTTNIMLQQLARDRGMIVEERPIDFEKEIGNLKEVGVLAESWI
jgi:branched-subunit amino acid aminotransferase/4-amino-4-deoxychorismate lyase